MLSYPLLGFVHPFCTTPIYSAIISLGRGSDPIRNQFSIYQLFANGEQGVWYDPSDIKLNWRRNLLTYSEQFDDSVWLKTQVTVTPNATTAPDEASTADAVFEAASTNSHFFRFGSSGAAPGVAKYTASLRVKANGRTKVQLFAEKVGQSIWAGCTFNLANNTFNSTPITAGGAAFVSASIADDLQGFKVITVVATSTALGMDGILVCLLDDAASETVVGPSYAGDAAKGIYVWGAQLELGSTSTEYQRITDGIQDYLTYQPLPILYQNAAGTTPVTAVEQPVGLMLDKSKGLVLGPELVANGGFAGVANGTDVTTLPGWAAYRTPTNRDIQSEQLRITTSAKDQGASLTLSTSAGKRYLLKAAAAGDLGIAGMYSEYTGDISTVGGKVGIFFVATGSSSTIYFRAANNSIGTTYYDNISVRELPGNHAFQTTSTKRPVLSARKNFYVNTETLATQNVTTRAAKYILSFWGTGSVTLSGTATGTLTGTGINDRVYLEFTATAGTLTSTVSGTVGKAQLEEV